MKTTHVIRDMQKFWREGDMLFRQCNFEGSVECYNKALKLCMSLPVNEKFDRRRFEASCQAGLSGALGRLGKHIESFAAANQALAFYDQFGEMYPADMGRWLMAMVNQGTALATLGCLADAQEAFQKAKEIFICKGLDTAGNKQWIEMVDGNIAAITAHIKEKEQ
jgi:tetratricopeptide (TPR) repeat protein